MVLLEQLSMVQWAKYAHSDVNLEIGDGRYYNAYIGHQINKIKSKARDNLIISDRKRQSRDHLSVFH